MTMGHLNNEQARGYWGGEPLSPAAAYQFQRRRADLYENALREIVRMGHVGPQALSREAYYAQMVLKVITK